MSNKFLLYILSALTFWQFQACIQTKREIKRPNIVWITTEDMSPQLGCYGDSLVKTPVIDNFGKHHGVIYTNAIATAPVCAPARSSIIMGMHQSSIGSHHMRTTGQKPEGFKFFPQYLREAGYYCTNNSKEDYNMEYKSEEIWNDSNKEAHWRNRKNKNQPFFSIFNYVGTHESCVNREDKHLTFTKDLKADQFISPDDIDLPVYYPDNPVTRKLWARYYSNISSLDLYVQNILTQLEEDGLADNTIIFFYSDHGAGVPFYKRWLYDTGLKVPLIIQVPERYKHLSPHAMGKQADELVSFVDLAPTVLNLVGLEIPQNMHGRAFLGKNLTEEREYVFAARDRMDERYDMQRAVRSKDYKYIRYYEPIKPYLQYMNTPEKGKIMKEIRKAHEIGALPEAGERLMTKQKPIEELFDLKNDPTETRNLVDDSEYEKILEQMKAAHKAWGIRVNDAGLIPEPILRAWEQKYDKSIYEILREEDVSISDIQRIALSNEKTELETGLIHENETIRYWAATGIGNHPEWVDANAKILLSNGLNDSQPLVRVAIARALLNIEENQEVLEILMKELNNADEWIRLNAALVLDEIGEKSRAAIPSLQAVMNDPNKYVTRVANHALNELLGTNNEVR